MTSMNRLARLLAAIGLLLVLTVGAMPGTATAKAGVNPQAPTGEQLKLCRMVTPNPGWHTVFQAVSATPVSPLGVIQLPSYVWAVGYSEMYQQNSPDFAAKMALIMRYDVQAQKWTQDALPPELPANTVLTAVSAQSWDDAWAVGYTISDWADSPVVLHYTGGIWRMLPSPMIYGAGAERPMPVSMYLTGVGNLALNTPIVVGYTEVNNRVRPVALMYGGDGWQSWDFPKLPDGTQMTGLFVRSATEIWAVAAYMPMSSTSPMSYILSYDGRNWGVSAATNGVLRAVMATSSSVFVVGHSYEMQGAATMTMSYDKANQLWLKIKSPNPDIDHNFLTALAAWNGDIYAVGYTGIPGKEPAQRSLLMRYNGYTFDEIALPLMGFTDHLYGVAGQYDLWAVGTSTVTNKWDSIQTLVFTTQCAATH